MAEHTITGKILLRNDTAAKWTSENPVLSKGEVGIEIDTNKFKIGDGTKTWTQLSYAGTVVAASGTNGHITIDGTDTTVYTLPTGGSSIGGVKTTSSGAGTVKINSAGTMQLNTSGASAGTYAKVTVNNMGVVTKGASLTASDIPDITLEQVSDAGTAASKDVGTESGNVPVLDSNGKLATSVLPALAITETYVVANQAAMLALSAQVGDVAVRTDQNKSYILKATPASTLANWQELLTPTDAVQSVNGKTGAVVLTTSDVTEGTNLYYTAARFNSAFAAKNSTDLKDGASLLHNTDTLIIDCGNA